MFTDIAWTKIFEECLDKKCNVKFKVVFENRNLFYVHVVKKKRLFTSSYVNGAKLITNDIKFCHNTTS